MVCTYSMNQTMCGLSCGKVAGTVITGIPSDMPLFYMRSWLIYSSWSAFNKLSEFASICSDYCHQTWLILVMKTSKSCFDVFHGELVLRFNWTISTDLSLCVITIIFTIALSPINHNHYVYAFFIDLKTCRQEKVSLWRLKLWSSSNTTTWRTTGKREKEMIFL